MTDLEASARVYREKVDAVAAVIDPDGWAWIKRVREAHPNDDAFAHVEQGMRDRAEAAISAMYGLGSPKIHADTADPATLVDRLRGIYRIPITDGLGPAGGDEPDNARYHVRHAVTGAIQHAAADRIEQLEQQLAVLNR